MAFYSQFTNFTPRIERCTIRRKENKIVSDTQSLTVEFVWVVQPEARDYAPITLSPSKVPTSSFHHVGLATVPLPKQVDHRLEPALLRVLHGELYKTGVVISAPFQ